ncbi:AAA family ATPase [Neobacillus cucumis]|uniref:ATP-binding protein n=1 Tax=Neobacillus cucumis TaxID=1740721 RepID=UPI0018E05430|nr:AAA family ATPase [Neobacillus cucumis]MBI0580141.1 AAA family ATPase [Neobacillus cucumis]
MKIVEIHIYGYGQLENIQIKNLADFQVFFGENEAGKSTIMAFLHGILFGFPTKQQSSELRYEPKHSDKYGGKIRIFHDDLGFAVIERVKGKSTGDVKVSLEDGRLGGEELLKELLGNFDKGLFQAIFSFNLNGLQNIHQMKGEEIGKFLFSAGTLGTERLSEAETVLQKEMETRFKPSGKKPLLNEKLQELHALNGELKKALAKNEEYDSFIKRQESIQEEMADIHHQLSEMQESNEKLNEWKKIHSLVKEELWTKTELADLGEIQFPAQGIERLERLNQLLYPYNAHIKSLLERIEVLKKEIAAMRPDDLFLEHESTLMTILDQIPLFDQIELEKQQYLSKLQDYQGRLSETLDRLHLPVKEEELLAINTNIYVRNEVEVVASRGKKLDEMKLELEERFQEEKTALEKLEIEVESAKNLVLPHKDRTLLEEKLNGEDKKGLENELNSIKDKIEFYRLANEREQNEGKKLQKQKKLQFLLFEIILLGLVFYGIFTKQWGLVSISVIAALLTGALMSKSFSQPKGQDSNPTLDSLRAKEKQVIQKLGSAEYANFMKLQEQLLLDNRRKEQLQGLQMRLEQQNDQYDKVISKFEAWEIESAKYKESLFTLASQLQIPEYIAMAHLREAFGLIEQYKTLWREKSHLDERISQIKEKQLSIENSLELFANRYLSEVHMDLHKKGYALREKLKVEHEKKIMSQERLAKLLDLEHELTQKKREQLHLKDEIKKLFDEAEASNEQQYYELGVKAEKQAKFKERLKDIQKQLQFSIITEPEREIFLHLHNIEEVAVEQQKEAMRLKERLTALQEEDASIKYEIQVLEEGGIYSELLHQFKQKKYELEEMAKEWSVYCLAQDILAKTVEKYKNTYLPRMLSKAEEYLFFLTEGRYHRIHLQKSGTGFLIERKDYTIFEANELSQATTEQVYVSIRLALATTLYEKYRFPIIIDDSFVNFDARRTQKIIELLKNLKQNQILFFTCHTHLLSNFSYENILLLNKGIVEIPS